MKDMENANNKFNDYHHSDIRPIDETQAFVNEVVGAILTRFTIPEGEKVISAIISEFSTRVDQSLSEAIKVHEDRALFIERGMCVLLNLDRANKELDRDSKAN